MKDYEECGARLSREALASFGWTDPGGCVLHKGHGMLSHMSLTATEYKYWSDSLKMQTQQQPEVYYGDQLHDLDPKTEICKVCNASAEFLIGMNYIGCRDFRDKYGKVVPVRPELMKPLVQTNKRRRDLLALGYRESSPYFKQALSNYENVSSVNTDWD